MNANVQQQLQRTTITVAYVNDPKRGKKTGSIKDTEDNYWSVWPNILRQFQPGESYELDYEQNGPFRNIKAHRRLVPQGRSAVGPAPANFITREEIEAQRQPRAAQAVPTDLRGEYSVVETASPQAPKAAAAGNQYYRPTAPRDAERMFTTATLGHFIDRGSIKCDADELVDAINTLRSAWQATFGADEQ